MKTVKGDIRKPSEVRKHYHIERMLAKRLRGASKEERKRLYAEVYDELFRRVPEHPLLVAKSSRAEAVADSVSFLSHFLHKNSTFLEIGPGDCQLALSIARKVKQVYAVDVSEQITKNGNGPLSYKLVLSDGINIPVPEESVDVAYSKDLLEHLHPDDVHEQAQAIRRCLVPGGIYICRTPNSLSGPHDVSRFFEDDVPTGLHLKEYTTTELAELFKSAGFSRVQPYFWGKGILIRLPLWPVVIVEAALSKATRKVQRAIAGRLPLKRVLSRVIVTK